jgi:hypothetical protein
LEGRLGWAAGGPGFTVLFAIVAEFCRMGPAISLMRFGYARPATLLSDFDHVADHISLGNSDSLHLNEQVEPYQQSQTKEISNRSIKRTFLRYVLKENKKVVIHFLGPISTSSGLTQFTKSIETIEFIFSRIFYLGKYIGLTKNSLMFDIAIQIVKRGNNKE